MKRIDRFRHRNRLTAFTVGLMAAAVTPAALTAQTVSFGTFLLY